MALEQVVRLLRSFEHYVREAYRTRRRGALHYRDQLVRQRGAGLRPDRHHRRSLDLTLQRSDMKV
jgi:hypothetical protein